MDGGSEAPTRAPDEQVLQRGGRIEISLVKKGWILVGVLQARREHSIMHKWEHYRLCQWRLCGGILRGFRNGRVGSRLN